MLEKYHLISLLNEILKQQARLRKGGNELVYFCPKCHHRKRKLECCIDENNKFFGAFNCWVCGLSGNLYDLLKFSIYPELYQKKLYELLKNVKLRKNYDLDLDNKTLSLPNNFRPLSDTQYKNDVEYKNAMAYLKRRCILYEDIVRYNIGYCSSGEYEHMIIIPSYNSEGNLNFFIGRKYYNTPGFPYRKANAPMENVIGFECFINWKEPIILVEGPFNAITIRRNAIPLFGKFPAEKLYEAMIVNKVEKVYIFLDNDAESDAVGVCKDILNKIGINPYLVKIKGGKDANEIGFEKSWECIREAKQFTEDDLLKYELGL